MTREKQLVKNTAIITVGKVCTQLINFILLPLYTSLLSTEEYGIVDLLNSYIFLLIPIITFQLEQAVFRFLIDIRNDENEKEKLVSTTVICMIIQIIAFTFLYIIGAQFFDNNYKYFLLWNIVANILSSIMLQISRGLGDNTTYAIGSFMTATITVILNVIFVAVFKLGAYGMLTSSIIANIITAIYIFMKKAFRLVHIKKFDKHKAKQLFKYAIPLIPNAVSWWILNVSDRTIITAILGVGMNGIYSAASKFSTLYTHVFNIFNMTWTESASMHINDEDRNEFFSKITNETLKIFFSLCIGIVSCMPFVFNILINEKFADAYYQIPILMLSSFLNIIIGLISVIYVARKKSKELAKTTIFSAIINIVAHLGLIKFIGIFAASISTVISCICMIIFRWIDIKKYINIKLSIRLIISMIIMTTYVFISYYINNIFLNIISLIITVIYVLVINKPILNSVIFEIKRRIRK